LYWFVKILFIISINHPFYVCFSVIFGLRKPDYL
jgi:hypothetical protein